MIRHARKAVAWYYRPKSKTADFFESLLVIIPIAFLIRTVGFGLYQVPTGSMETTMLVGERFFADKLTPYFMPFHRGDIISFNDPTFQYSSNPLKYAWQMYVWGPSNWTKRLIGLPGERVQGVVEDGKPVIYINGKKLEEPYLNKYPLILTFDEDRERAVIHKSYDESKSYDEQPFYRLTRDEVIKGKKVAFLNGEPPMLYPSTPHEEILDMGKPTQRRAIVDNFDVTLGPNQYWVMGDNRQGSYDARAWGHPLDGKLIHGKIVLRIWSLDSDESWAIIDLLKHPIDFWRRVRWSRFFQLVR